MPWPPLPALSNLSSYPISIRNIRCKVHYTPYTFLAQPYAHNIFLKSWEEPGDEAIFLVPQQPIIVHTAWFTTHLIFAIVSLTLVKKSLQDFIHFLDVMVVTSLCVGIKCKFEKVLIGMQIWFCTCLVKRQCSLHCQHCFACSEETAHSLPVGSLLLYAQPESCQEPVNRLGQ